MIPSPRPAGKKHTTADKLYTSCEGSQDGSIWIQKIVTLLWGFRGVNIHFMGSLKHTPTLYLPGYCRHWHIKGMLYNVCDSPHTDVSIIMENKCAVPPHFKIFPSAQETFSTTTLGIVQVFKCHLLSSAREHLLHQQLIWCAFETGPSVGLSSCFSWQLHSQWGLLALQYWLTFSYNAA